jgi:hypothetical protein
MSRRGEITLKQLLKGVSLQSIDDAQRVHQGEYVKRRRYLWLTWLHTEPPDARPDDPATSLRMR